jgi:hypothetical protein
VGSSPELVEFAFELQPPADKAKAAAASKARLKKGGWLFAQNVISILLVAAAD